MRQGIFLSQSPVERAISRFSATICGARPTAASPGRSSRRTGSGGGDKQWFTIDKTGGPGHGFQYQADDGINCSGSGVEFQRSTNGGVTWQSPIEYSTTRPYTGLSMWTPTAIVFVGGEGNTFYCVRSSNAQIGGQTPTFDQETPRQPGWRPR